MAVYSKKYLTLILGILVGISAVVFAVSQILVGLDTPDAQVQGTAVPSGAPSIGIGPTHPPYVTPPTVPPPY